METEFTPWLSTFGGILIGLASVLLMAYRGRVYGATGIVTGFLFPKSAADWQWRAALLAGMLSAPVAYLALTGGWPQLHVPASNGMLMIGGLIVGVGVSYGNGCTSGHGICGIARFSPRSITATITFMIFTAITVYVIRHVVVG